MAIMFAFYGLMYAAFWAIIAGAVFDFFDGMTARLLHVSSPIGKELDSLADVVTFGVAPSAILFSYLVYFPGNKLSIWGAAVVFLMAAFSALRLAKFNLDERQTMGFIGMPTPANALFWSSLVVGWGRQLWTMPSTPVILLVLMLLSCYLLVSEIPMFALKFKTWGWRGNEVKWVFLLSCIPLVLWLGYAAPSVIIAWYLLLSILTQKHSSEPTTPNS